MPVSVLEREVVTECMEVLAPATGVFYRSWPIREANEEERRQFTAQGRPDQIHVTNNDPLVKVGDMASAQAHVAYVKTKDCQYFVPMPADGIVAEICEEGQRVTRGQTVMKIAPS